MSRVLGDYVTLQRGTTYKSSLLGQPGPVLLGLASIARNGGFRDDSLRTYGGESPEKLLLNPGDLFVSLKDVTQSADLLGAAARVPDHVKVGRLTQDTVKLVLNDSNSADYIYWLLRTPQYRDYCRERAIGTTNLSLSREDFLAFKVPALNRQRELLVALLGALDDKIAVNDRIVENVDKLGRALFQSHLGPALDSLSLGLDLPDHWRLTSLNEVAAVLETGSRPRGGVAAYSEGIPSIGAESIVRLARFDFAKVKYVPASYFAAMARGVLEDRDVLLYKDGGRPGAFEPHVSMFGEGFPFPQMSINEHVYRIRFKAPLSQEFGYFWLSSDPILAEMRIRGTGVAIPGLNSSAARGLPVVLPPAERLLQFDAMARPLVRRALIAARESSALADIRSTLLPKLITGELRIKETEQLVSEVA